jgi:putative ABC transport system permease protein
MIAVDLANEGASKAFKISMDEVTGKATHHIISPSGTVPDSIYRKLRIEYNIENSAPIIEQTLTIEGIEGIVFTLLGVDPYSERKFRSSVYQVENNASSIIANTGHTAALSNKTANKLNLDINDRFNIINGGKTDTMQLAAVFEKSENSLAFDNVILCDISTAQAITQITGISRIDLILNEKETNLIKNEFLSDIPGIQLIDSESKKGISSQMTEAFEVNLTAMSLLALIVGMFLIYNTMTFSVVQRREYLGLLRSIGVTGKEIFSLIMNEAAFFAFIGIILGMFAGIVLGSQMIKLVSRTINDLYFTVNVTELYISPLSLIKGAAIGLATTFVAAAKPALDAARSSISNILKSSSQESGTRKNFTLQIILGVIAAIAGAVILYLPSKNIILGFAGFIPLIISFALLTPVAVIFMVRLLKPITKWIFGTIGAMSIKGISDRLSRTGIAIAALAVAVSAVVGVGTMVSGFRTTVVHWLEMRLSSDIYISAPSLISSNMLNPIEPEIRDVIKSLEGVVDTDAFRKIEIDHEGRRINVMAGEMKEHSKQAFLFTEGNKDEIWNKLLSNENYVAVTEVYAYKNDLKRDDTFTLPTKKGLVDFKVAGIYYDYSTDVGLVSMYRPYFLDYFQDTTYSGISVKIAVDEKRQEMIDKIAKATAPYRELSIRSNKTLLDNSIAIFDRTFLITNVLQILAVIVAFIGILSTLISLQLERKREIGILRSIGLTPGNINLHIILQTGLTGLIAGILSLPLGNLLAVVLIYIINKRSFGWSLQYEFLLDLQIQAIIVSIVAAILAGIYPALKMSRINIREAIKSE